MFFVLISENKLCVQSFELSSVHNYTKYKSLEIDIFKFYITWTIKHCFKYKALLDLNYEKLKMTLFSDNFSCHFKKRHRSYVYQFQFKLSLTGTIKHCLKYRDSN